ncbi:thiamine pyrophosphate-binding protein [Aeromicrobium phragmitis]|uniref:Thiamine pyrophosphate-binding protein n=1 Tax=Aeromicrobium phragmitis TaxID=2478914 RepID=A0A3L8PPC4_9ACTN|nr:thiamine pyrophosphate-dependent enzyme [Aeromicrobium phragmitis]RLV57221.1 thiamine pyrophosphate-binding protein [Aeromicrobium phragmitis]
MRGTFNDLFAQALRALDVDVMFGVMGDANMYIADSFHRLPGGRFVSSANEGGAVLMAAGHAAVTGQVGVATVTHGAIANCVSALFDAVRGGYPVLVIAGDTSRAEGMHLQNIPQREVVVPTGAEYREVRSPQTAALDLAAALRSAVSARRPVVLGIPSDFHQAECSMELPRATVLQGGVAHPSRDALEEAAGVIIGSSRPLLIAGRGAGAAEEALTALAERIGAPIATTLRGKGLFQADPCLVGICGTLANPVASETIARSDCLLVFGGALTSLTTLKGELLEGKRVVQIDVDSGALGRHFPVDVGVVADAGVAAAELVEILDEAGARASNFRSEALARKVEEFRREDRAAAQDDGPLTLTGVLHRVNHLVDPDRSLCIDGGRFSHEALRILDVAHPSHYAHCLNVGHIGLSVGYGIGAALARPDARTLVVAGDGGFMLGGLTEFNTAVRYDANLVLVLLNDNAYGAEYYRFVNQEFDPALTTFSWPSFAGIAEALGGRGVQVTKWSDFDALPHVLERPGPVLVEVVLDTASIPDPGDH